jgi:hypothetical protein
MLNMSNYLQAWMMSSGQMRTSIHLEEQHLLEKSLPKYEYLFDATLGYFNGTN